MPLGQKSWVCPRCKELQEHREWVHSLEVLVADQEKQRRGERDHGETSRDLQAPSTLRQAAPQLLGLEVSGVEDGSMDKREAIP